MDLFIKNPLEERYKHVKQTLSDYREAIEIMVKELFDKEVITVKGCVKSSANTKSPTI